ncbi:MAG: ABC transporter ATP-binding protein [Peptococcaceae bacterium]|nr:ABC transporter ATP-binding protein [Peptococcaceae bacterium]
MEAVIQVSNLSKAYGSVVALERVSFSVQNGEIFGFLGPNGAGKTTMVNILSAQLTPSSGVAKVMGQDCAASARAVKSLIGVASANPRALYWRLTGEENLKRLLPLYYLKRGEGCRRIEALLRQVSLYDCRHQLVGNYSTGMRARLMLAKAMLHDPPVLILDEPWATLDPEGRVELTEYLRAMARDSKKTILVCAHDLALMERICSRVAVIHRGKILFQGTIDNMREQQGLGHVLEIDIVEGAEAATLVEQCAGVFDLYNLDAGRLRIVTPDLSSALRFINSIPCDRISAVTIRRFSLEDAYLLIMRNSRGAAI